MTLFNGIDAANARIVDRRENDCSVLEGVEGGMGRAGARGRGGGGT